MRRRSKTGREPVKARRDKAAPPKHRNGPKAVRRRRPAAPGQEKKDMRLAFELNEARELQAASAEVLRVISTSPKNVQPVFDIIAESAVRLCQGQFSFVLRFDNDLLYFGACHGLTPEGLEAFRRELPRPAAEDTASGRSILHRAIAQIPDVLVDSTYVFVRLAQAVTYRSILAVPMLRDGHPIGTIAVARAQVGLFSAGQIALLQTFADQAVIAIENVRLFEAEQQRTRELTESLEQQTATSEVLQVIASSPGDLEPVFAAILEKAIRICGAKLGTLNLREEDRFRVVAMHGVEPALKDKLQGRLLRLAPNTMLGRLLRTRDTTLIADVLAEPGFFETPAGFEGPFLALHAGARTLLGVPIVRENTLLGGILIFRQEVRPFTDKQIALVTSFASQAAIAIENTRLLNELRQRTDDLTESLEQQTATSDVLGVISRSKFELQPILQSVVDTAARLCRAEAGVIFRREDGIYRFAAGYSLDPAYLEIEQKTPIVPGQGTVVGRAAMTGQVARIDDAWTDPLYEKKQEAKIGKGRSMIGVPLMREGEPIGVIGLARSRVDPFTEREIDLVTTFADQAVIAIENVRLFEAEQQRTQELARSIEDLRTAQDRLIQTEKLASLGQLTAGIAHEIKNPLNFVNNFSAVSVELIDELREALQGMQIDNKQRAGVNEIAGMLQGNLDKVVQHGKRADAIVKNMLLHSRQGSGEHRPVNINALVEESLNLAYHGARAEKQGFNITLERSFDAAAGEVDLFPQEITRVLLNLISNGFYAATKRKADPNGGDYEPALVAATKSLGDSVEIRIRDNGTGIPPEVKEKLFNPFFTTKPAGEGTGLGLSISHDIVVKQHGGSIEVDTQPGEFTEFRIILPRAGTSLIKSGERA